MRNQRRVRAYIAHDNEELAARSEAVARYLGVKWYIKSTKVLSESLHLYLAHYYLLPSVGC